MLSTSVSSGKISVPVFSSTPGVQQQEEVQQAAVVMERLSSGVSVFPTMSHPQPRRSMLKMSSPCMVMTKALKPVQPVQGLSVQHYDHFGDEGSSDEESVEDNSSEFSCFEIVRINYLQDNSRPIVAPFDSSFLPARRVPAKFYDSNKASQNAKRSLRVFNPDVPSGPLIKAKAPLAIHVDKTTKVTCGPIRQPLRALKVVNIPTTSSGFFPHHQRIDIKSKKGQGGKENIEAVHPIVRRKPVPKLVVDDDARKSSFMRFSTMGSFPVRRPKDGVNIPAFPLVLRSMRTDVVKHLSLRHVLGQGAQGKVYLAQTARPYKLHAVKVIPKLTVLEDFQMVLQEQQLLKRVKGHRFLLGIQDSFHDTENFYLVTDYHPGGDLAHLLFKLKTFETDMARFYIAELIVAVKFLHENNIVHRDLKPGNLLIKADGHVCVADFGLCKDWGSVSDLHYAKLVEDHLGIIVSPTTFGFAGTLVYMSPQSVAREAYSYEADWWAVGVILYEFLQGDCPWTGADVREITRKVRKDPLAFRDGLKVDGNAKDFISQLLKKNKEERIQVEEFPQHEFFSQTDFNDVEDGLLTPPYIPRNDGNLLAFGKLNDTDKLYVGRAYDNGVDPFPEYDITHTENLDGLSSRMAFTRMIEMSTQLAQFTPPLEPLDLSPTSMVGTIMPLSPRPPARHCSVFSDVAGQQDSSHSQSHKPPSTLNLPVSAIFGPQHPSPCPNVSVVNPPHQVSSNSAFTYSELRERFKNAYGFNVGEDPPMDSGFASTHQPSLSPLPTVLTDAKETEPGRRSSVKSNRPILQIPSVISQLMPNRASISPPAASLLTASSVMFDPNSLFSVNVSEANETRTSIGSMSSVINLPASTSSAKANVKTQEVCPKQEEKKSGAGLPAWFKQAAQTVLGALKQVQLGFKKCFGFGFKIRISA